MSIFILFQPLVDESQMNWYLLFMCVFKVSQDVKSQQLLFIIFSINKILKNTVLKASDARRKRQKHWLFLYSP